jgi:hypothetical protein
MVSKASELLPDPETPLITVSFPWGISQETFFRLWVRAPRMMISSLNGRVSTLQGKVPQFDYRGGVEPLGLC